ncbi:uncharacterized protein PITG_19813 [Phytophthora infestans T30-4]|uniref:Uncharacterized protein n=1 Tax=Phytophthora infestans (strain T30-4) TaxID=403677 RepID=D0P1G3_PHYIT|nr:uncharacterized protein PITG_19813 [Phytophthora infestans T30-4]EEY54585.1 conserved hypothetical protein [Phytophthora infestans T30-4]|eukprot:XP_002895865.1 conserved hypothetical protein [Phytophthora infestans T30-4]
MTPTGSSLIVNPRLISKELEAKIATAIAGVIASHDVSKLTTKLVRQAVEKEIRVSLTNHKEVLKRLMHQELRKLKAKKLAKRAAPEPWKIAMRRESIAKGLNCIYQMLREAAGFPDWGLHAIQSLYDLQAVEEGDILRLATLYARLIGALWLKEDRHVNWAVGSIPTPTQLVNAMSAVYLVERVGISHARRVELLDFCDRSPVVYGAKELLGWNPAESPPPTDDKNGPSIYERLTSALVVWHHSHALGISLGFTLPQLLQHLLLVYPYKGPSDLSPQEYEDQALRCFEGSCNLVQMHRGMAYLLLTQREDGSWMTESAHNDPNQRYFLTMQAVWALCEPHRVGFAPAFPEATPMLELNLNVEMETPDGVFVESLKVSDVEDAAVDSEVAAATAAAPADTEDVATRVAFLQGLLDQNGYVKNVSPALATHVLSTLADMVLTVEILKSTGVGRTINKLRKHTTASVAKAATQLVAKWKNDLL